MDILFRTQEYTIYMYPADRERPSTEELLRRCAADYAPGADCREIARTPAGKPWFPRAPWLHCSVTHSGGWWLAAFARRPIGLDLQIHRPCDARRLARRFFHPREAEWLEEEGRTLEDFFAVWTAKESYAKLTGRGIADGFAAFSVLPPDPAPSSVPGASPDPAPAAAFHYLPFQSGYTLCLAL